MTISRKTMDSLRQLHILEEVVSEKAPLLKGQATLRRCPFHSEKEGSLSINRRTSKWKCFGCDRGGDVIAFLRESGMSFSEAVEHLGNRFGITIEHDPGTAVPGKTKGALDALRVAQEAFRSALTGPGSVAARDYLKTRGIGNDAISQFGIGYGGRGNTLKDALSKAGIPFQVAVDIGLLGVKESKTYTERFFNRITFPICDLGGKVVGFGARALSTTGPKYLNSSESDVFHKQDVLFGVSQAVREIREKNAVFVVEGYTDLISLWQKGVRNVTATAGTALTESHARLLGRLTRNVIMVFDGDDAGRKSTIRAAQTLYAEGFTPCAVLLPEGQDPDDWAKSTTPQVIAETLDKKIPVIEIVESMAEAHHGIDTEEHRLAYLRTMVPYLRMITDPLELAIYVQKIARKASIPESVVAAAL